MNAHTGSAVAGYLADASQTPCHCVAQSGIWMCAEPTGLEEWMCVEPTGLEEWMCAEPTGIEERMCAEPSGRHVKVATQRTAQVGHAHTSTKPVAPLPTFPPTHHPLSGLCVTQPAPAPATTTTTACPSHPPIPTSTRVHTCTPCASAL